MFTFNGHYNLRLTIFQTESSRFINSNQITQKKGLLCTVYLKIRDGNQTIIPIVQQTYRTRVFCSLYTFQTDYGVQVYAKRDQILFITYTCYYFFWNPQILESPEPTNFQIFTIFIFRVMAILVSFF